MCLKSRLTVTIRVTIHTMLYCRLLAYLAGCGRLVTE
jgi:hypothetical protein